MLLSWVSKAEAEYFFGHSPFKGTVPRDFRLQVFFMNQFPQAPEYTIRVFSNLQENLRRYLQQMEKSFNQKGFNHFYGTDIVPIIFVTGVVDTGGKVADFVVDTGGNMLQVLLTPAANLLPVLLTPRSGKFANSIINTSDDGGKFADGVVDTGGKSMLLMILVMYLDLRISLQIFKKISNDPNVIFRGFWEDDS
jgi:hypothetical protein